MSAIACSILQLSVPIFRINVFLSVASRLEGRGTSVAAGGLSTTHGELMLNQCFFCCQFCSDILPQNHSEVKCCLNYDVNGVVRHLAVGNMADATSFVKTKCCKIES